MVCIHKGNFKMMNSESPYLELLKRLNYNDEINFFYNGKEYWISRSDHEVYLTECANADTVVFTDNMDLLNNARIDGKTIKMIWPYVEL